MFVKVLASVSPVFASIFEEDNNKDEIEVDDVTSDEFEHLLKVIQPGSRVDIPGQCHKRFTCKYIRSGRGHC